MLFVKNPSLKKKVYNSMNKYDSLALKFYKKNDVKKGLFYEKKSDDLYKDNYSKIWGVKVKKSKKGQLSIANLIIWFVTAMIMGVLSIILQPFMTLAAENALAANQTTQAVIIYMIIPFMWIALLAALMYMATPQSGGFRQF